MTKMGMDVDAVENVGRQLKQSAASVESLLGSIDKTVSGMTGIWDGPDAQRFLRQSWPSLRKTLVVAQVRIDGLGQSALNNASEQRQASSIASAPLAMRGSVTGDQSATNTPDARITTSSSGVTVHVTEHPDARTTVTDDAQSGVHSSADGSAGPDRSGHFSADGSLHGEAGIRASETTTHDLGGGATFSDTGGSFAGAEGDLNGGASVGVDGIKLNAGANAFAGTEADVKAQFSSDYAAVGIGAGVMAGVGVKANAHADFGWDNISLGFQLGVSVGVGVQVQPSVSFSPKSIVDHLLGVSW